MQELRLAKFVIQDLYKMKNSANNDCYCCLLDYFKSQHLVDSHTELSSYINSKTIFCWDLIYKLYLGLLIYLLIHLLRSQNKNELIYKKG